MATTTQPVGTRTALTSASLATLAAATFCVSSTKTNSPVPMNVAVEVSVTIASAPSAGTQAAVYAQMSLDGTNYQTGPTSGTATTSEPDLRLLGTVPVKEVGQHTAFFSLIDAFGFVPPYFRIVVKNDTGVVFTAGAIFTSDISVVST